MHPVHAELRMTDEQAPGWSRVEDRSEVGEAGIVFDKVGLGLTLKANCSLDDENLRWQTPRFAGPINPGERVTIDVLVAPGEACSMAG